MHVAGSQNTAADFLSCLELTPIEKVQLKLRDDIITAPIEVNLQSTNVADEEQLFSYQMRKKNQNKKPIHRNNRSSPYTAQYGSLRIWSNQRKRPNTQRTRCRSNPESTKATPTPRRIRQTSPQN